jgi:3-oxoacyl-[acyl-carrier-protein] synthase-3
MHSDTASLFIQGTGSYVPQKALSNDELAQMVDTSDEWIRTRTGIEKRHIAAAGENTSDIAVEAAKKAIANAGLQPEAIDLLIVATISPDQPFPATACLVQTKLGLRPIAAFDLSAACTGFLYILETATALLEKGPYKNALIIGAEKFSSILDWEDRTTCVLFGDGAGAAVISRENKTGFTIVDSLLGADGANADILCIPAGGSACPTSPHTLEARLQYLKMNGREVFKQAVRVMGQVAETLLERNGLSPADIKVFIPHQANVRIIEALAKRFDLPLDRFFVNLTHYGNTSAASIPIALDEARYAYTWQKGDYVLLVAFGAGLTWGSTLLRYTEPTTTL